MGIVCEASEVATLQRHELDEIKVDDCEEREQLLEGRGPLDVKDPLHTLHHLLESGQEIGRDSYKSKADLPCKSPAGCSSTSFGADLWERATRWVTHDRARVSASAV